MSPDHIGYETELRLLREFERGFRFTLASCKRLAACEKVGDQSAARNVRKAQVPCFLRRPERGSYQCNGGAHVACPGNNVPEPQVDTCLEAEQPAVLYQIHTELTEAVSRLIVAEPRPQQHSEPDIGEA